MFLNKKAFFSIISILFISIFITTLITNNIKNNDLEYKKIIIANYLNLKKENQILNINEIIKLNLDNDIEDPLILKEMINLKLINYFEKNNVFYILDIIELKESFIDNLTLDDISKVIVYKANNKLLVKKYIITNSINKNLYLKIKIKNKELELNYLFPKNYTIDKYVYIN
jgi:hypothetical protein